MQELHLKVRHIIIVKGNGTDKISFAVPNDKVLNEVLGSTEARQCFPELHFDLQITKGKGEALLSALGLMTDEIISAKTSYNFKRPQRRKI